MVDAQFAPQSTRSPNVLTQLDAWASCHDDFYTAPPRVMSTTVAGEVRPSGVVVTLTVSHGSWSHDASTLYVSSSKVGSPICSDWSAARRTLRTRHTPEIGSSSAADADADGPTLADVAGPEALGAGPDAVAAGSDTVGAEEGVGVVGDGMQPATTDTMRAMVAATIDPRGPMG